MAAWDAHYRFTMVDMGAFGRQSDSGVFKESAFESRLLEGKLEIPLPTTLPGTDVMTPYTFVGNAAFPQNCNSKSPFSG